MGGEQQYNNVPCSTCPHYPCTVSRDMEETLKELRLYQQDHVRRWGFMAKRMKFFAERTFDEHLKYQQLWQKKYKVRRRLRRHTQEVGQ